MRDGSHHESRRNGGCRFAFAGGIVAAAFTLLAAGNSLFAREQVGPALDALGAAYPNALAGHDANALRWRDGAAMPVSAGAENKTVADLLQHASILDQLRISYPRGPLDKPPCHE